MKLTWFAVEQKIREALKDGGPRDGATVWGVPRGGIHVAQLLCKNHGCRMASCASEAEWIVDDVIDSGATRDFWQVVRHKQFWVPIDKTILDAGFIVFPWESEEEEEPEPHFRRFIQSMGGMGMSEENQRETPARVVRAFSELTSGLGKDPKAILSKRFKVKDLNEMVLVRDIPFWSLCEHHMLPFSGHATVAYIAKDYAVGLSKIPRLVQCFAKRLQMQERMTEQIASSLIIELNTVGAACLIRGSHTCMKIRGVQSDGEMVTSALFGVFRDDYAVRQEFLNLAGMK